jgi:hypothetical protein
VKWFLPLTVFLVSCGPPKAPCESTVSCGELEACIFEKCTPVDCLGNTDCALEEFCNLETYTCDPGCTTSDDCLIGDRCDVLTNTCVERQCTDTQLDCEFGERCDLDTGRCKRDPARHCDRCFNEFGCGPTGVCAAQPDGNAYCFLECQPESFDPCPSGMQCSRTTEGLFRCVGFCGGI